MQLNYAILRSLDCRKKSALFKYMPKVNIDLGQDWDDMGPVEIARDRVSYPSFHVTSEEKIDFPHEGEMTIRFKKVASSMNERADGESRYECTIEVHKIVELYPDKEDSRETKVGDALDDIAKTVMKARGKGKSGY